MPKGNLLFECNITLDRQSQSKLKVDDNRKVFFYFRYMKCFFKKSIPPELIQREQNVVFEKVALPNDLIDFASNDYLGFSQSGIFLRSRTSLIKNKCIESSDRSRFLSNCKLHQEKRRDFIANFHQTETALLFNSSDAIIGFLVQFLKKEI
jgi:8-amino-7-oxononanoate synthase